jgi:predicted molibdopterin-dependent oxidoreductase YjgC
VKARIQVDGQTLETEADVTVLAALWNAGLLTTRTSIGGEPRGALCGMGVCFECRVTLDGRPQRRACLELVRDGLEVRTGG